MTGEIMLLMEVVDYALQLLRIRESNSRKEKALQRAFVEAFRDALILTRAYIADRREGVTEVNRERELELSRAWNAVGLCGRDIEPMGDFYAVFFEKSNYWSDPSGWELADTGELDISLENAENEATRIVGGL
jgi:hypothetical protein